MGLDFVKVGKLREKAGLTQAEAAEKAGLAGGRQSWNDVESGRRANIKIDTLESIARALGVKPGELLK